MRGRKSSLKMVLSDAERTALEHVTRSTSVAAGLARRARIVLLVAEGVSLVETARRVGVMETVVRLWCRRFLERRLEGLADLPRSGRPPVFSPRGGPVCGEVGLRTARCGGTLAVAVGLSGDRP